MVTLTTLTHRHVRHHANRMSDQQFDMFRRDPEADSHVSLTGCPPIVAQQLQALLETGMAAAADKHAVTAVLRQDSINLRTSILNQEGTYCEGPPLLVAQNSGQTSAGIKLKRQDMSPHAKHVQN